MEVDHSGKTCYDCGKGGHIGADCPERAARIAAGGPARLPKEPAKGRGASNGTGAGKGNQWQPNKGQWQPTNGQWKSYYPGPSQTRWNSWFPPKGAGKGGAANWFAGEGQTLKSATQVVPEWLLQPGGRIASFVEKQEQGILSNSCARIRSRPSRRRMAPRTSSCRERTSRTTLAEQHKERTSRIFRVQTRRFRCWARRGANNGQRQECRTDRLQ